MRHLAGVGTNRGYSMIGLGMGLGLSEFRLSSAGFSPTSISGLKLWLDASDSATVYQSNGGSLASADGDPVGYWVDKSSVGNHASQASGTSKPAYRTNVQNGKPVLRFDGTNDILQLASTILASSSCTYFIVWKPSVLITTSVGVKYVFGGNNFGLYTSSFGGGIANERITFASDDAGASCYLGECTEDIAASFHLFSMTYNRANLADPLYWRNGTSKTLTSNGTTAGNDWETLGNLCVKNIGNIPGTFGQKDIAEFIAYDSSLSTTDRQKVETYLNAKWGIY